MRRLARRDRVAQVRVTVDGGRNDDPPEPSHPASGRLGPELPGLDETAPTEAGVARSGAVGVEQGPHDDELTGHGGWDQRSVSNVPQASRNQPRTDKGERRWRASGSRVTGAIGLDLPLDLLVVGHTNLDHLLRVPGLPEKDRTAPVLSHELALGGTAANIARAAAFWGVRVGLVSRVGADFPPAFRAQLVRARVDLRGLESVRSAFSSACYIAEDGKGGQSTLIDQGPMGDDFRFRVSPPVLARAPWAHLTTGAPEYLFATQSAVRARGGRVAVDPAQEIHYRWTAGGLRRLLRGSEILFGNEHEVERAAELLGVKGPSALLDRIPTVVVTLGKRGAAAYSRSGTVRVPAVRPRRLRQITGAGDAFRGGFYAGWFEGTPLKGCLVAGVRSAARWIEGAMVAPPRRAGARGGR